MQSEDPGLRQYHRPENRIANQITSRASGGSSSGQGKLSHSPGHWKKYISSETNLKSPVRREANYNNTRKTEERTDFPDRQQGDLQEHQVSKLEQQKRRKEDMMRRVEEIQKKVSPILKNQRNEADENYGWTNRMEQRILKLETNIDSIEKEMHIKIERRLLEVQREWNAKIEYLLESHKEKVMGRDNRNGYHNSHRNQELQKQRVQEHKSNRKYPRPDVYQESSQNYRSFQLEEAGQKEGRANVEGFFTKRQNQSQEAIDDHI